MKRPQQTDRHINYPQSLLDYVERINGEIVSFRKILVKEYHRGGPYYIEKAFIKIGADGKITAPSKEYEPTKAEQEAIIEAFETLSLPKSINVTKQGYEDWLSRQTGDKSRFYPMYDYRDMKIAMIQELVMKQDGGKQYLAWSFWDDLIFRPLEPDGKLPLWKPPIKHGRARILISEGAKVAKYVDDLLQDPERLKAHPWGEFFNNFESWGMIGGAQVPHRTDWESVRRERPIEVIYCADNDFPGESALQKVSEAYGQKMKGLKFGKAFPISYDFADPVPESMFKAGRYIGKPIRSFIQPATRATELVQTGKGRPTAILKPDFREEWIHAVAPEVFIHKDFPNKIRSASEFNNLVRPFSNVDDTARLVKADDTGKGALIKYDPSRPSGIYGDGRYINTHVPSDIVAEEGDPGPWLEFMERLVPLESDRLELMKFCGTLIARPDIKILWGVLLISELQGIGKSTLGEKILKPLLGEENVSQPAEHEIVDSNFNYWCAHKRLAIVHEIYSGHSVRAYNRLKSIITEDHITVSKKYQANYDIENWIHIFACSNSKRALQLSADDRRWFVPKVSETKASTKYWGKFFSWLNEEGGLSIIKWWAEKFIAEQGPALKGEDAPWSAAKTEVVEEGFSLGQAIISRMFDQFNEELAKPHHERWQAPANGDARITSMRGSDTFLVLDTDLVSLIKFALYHDQHNDKLERALTLRKIAKMKGWFTCKAVATTVPTWKCRAMNARILVNDINLIDKPVSWFIEQGIKPLDLKTFMEM